MRILSSLAVGFFLVHTSLAQNASDYPDPCENDIYCRGDLLKAIQMTHIHKDDKTFVDLALRFSPQEVLANFAKLNYNSSIPPEDAFPILKEFIEANFENGTEFEDWVPGDWVNNPKFLEGIVDENLQVFATELHGFWDHLGRKIKLDVNITREKYSMLFVSQPVIIPGGRFREFYYWDSYWIQKGLLLSEMKETVRGMIENFFEMVENIGYVPNGGRIYYERSQPPLLLPMVKNYLDNTNDTAFIKENIETMRKEFDFFMKNRTVEVTYEGKQYLMARYNVDRKGPRPESYSHDYDLVEPMSISEEEKQILYANLKAGAESGWDFSSRWYVPMNQIREGNLSLIKTRDIIPVDLNGFLYWNAVILTELCGIVDDVSKCNATEYQQEANKLKTAINTVLWDEEVGSWLDYDFVRPGRRNKFFPSNLVPLWVHADEEGMGEKVLNYFYTVGADKYPGGVPTSLDQTGEQWDFPNGWAPLNHIVVEAFENSGNSEAKELAFSLAQKWILNNYKAYMFNDTKRMYEKYDVSTVGQPGGGGEYEIVIGFGWSNAVVLDFLNMYGDRLTSSSDPVPNFSKKPEGRVGGGSSQIGFSAIAVTLSIMVSLIMS